MFNLNLCNLAFQRWKFQAIVFLRQHWNIFREQNEQKKHNRLIDLEYLQSKSCINTDHSAQFGSLGVWRVCLMLVGAGSGKFLFCYNYIQRKNKTFVHPTLKICWKINWVCQQKHCYFCKHYFHILFCEFVQKKKFFFDGTIFIII